MDGLNNLGATWLDTLKETLPVASKAFQDSYLTYKTGQPVNVGQQTVKPPAPVYKPNWWLIGGGVALGAVALMMLAKKKRR